MAEPVAPLIAANPVTVVSNANYNQAWTHAAGDLLVLLWSSTAVPVPPAAGGTVPEWKPLTNTNLPQNLTSFGGSSMMLTVWYAWATRTGHTAGTWTNGNFGWMVALRNADKTNPFGSGSRRMDSVGGQTYPTAPGVGTMEFPGKSVVIHNFGWNHSSSLSYMTSPSASNGGLIQCTSTTGVRGNYVGYQSAPTSAGTASAGLTAGANVTSGLSVEVVPLRPGPGINVLHSGTWKRSTPKAIMQDGVWTPTKRISVLTGGQWKEVWPNTPAEPEPQYLYDVTFEYLPNYEVQFHIKKGYVSADPNWEEIIMLQSTIMGNPGPGGYCTRDPIFEFGDPGATYYNCTFTDRTGVPGDATTRDKTVTVKVYPKP